METLLAELRAFARKNEANLEEADIYGYIDNAIDDLKYHIEKQEEEFAANQQSDFQQHSVWNSTQLGL